ncbi:RagB/SusD family nutrient uptake outer membrane protein [Dysgonomonas sp. HGC4]|uniref:RagB/SusD family nutrient uptake outer membrane protein n=1 Tax=Dysgonomonas sp. HGC4 TaxID=1658009 RepID=UPI00068355F6|nr:RagB/SusD family nutrient uptake outer membrane protein [Dysgonomonas sp. HGC4]MBD8347250.1 RagB/SusD family nutrient uptake outer membrane protein [Dysgonomonas sp. HGC4]
MKKIKYIAVLFAATIIFSSCDFLNDDPQGILSDEQVKGPDQVEGLVTAAYSSLGNDHYDKPFSLWPYGNVRSDDAYKGGNDENDISAFHFYEIAQNIKTDFGEADGLWFYCYKAISRTNTALSVLKTVSTNDVPLRDTRMGEMYFLRGHFYFILKTVFGRIPFVDEDLPIDEYDKVDNKLPNDEQWAWIVSDFQKAYDLLPDKQDQVGRANKIAAAAYLAKANLYKAYRQDDRNNVTEINRTDLEEVLKYTDKVLNSGYGLEYDFAYNFLPGAYQNGKESLFAVQYSIDDGTMFGRLNWGDVLSVPMGVGCCDFHKPSQNLVNAFKTDKTGLPMFDSFDNTNYDSNSNNADPRLFHTVAMPGFPYKYNKDLIYEEGWNRNPTVYGYYASLKENVDPSCDCFVNVAPFYGNSKNRIIIRYADAILMRAEALIELGRPNEALPLINQIRERAQRSTDMIDYAPKLSMSLYQPGVNCAWSTDFARQALRWERRLEFAMEGSRFFDLVRWGITDQVVNSFFKTESSRRPFLKSGNFTKNKNEYIPIPQQQINFVNGIYKQNYGW